ncbi:MAG: c-type cytochrome [Planctomycetes bacterium]|nr:c-type cytochrome [Planctomycetota bacterium]
MLSKSAARNFFVLGTGLCFGAFVLLTLDTLSQIPKQTNEAAMTEAVVRGKHLWDSSNCMGCHTILGEGAYYGPELTKVYERRGPAFIAAVIRDPDAMFPGQRRMQSYGFEDEQIQDLVAFLEWIGNMDLNGFPRKPNLGPGGAAPGVPTGVTATPPPVFSQLCLACHQLGGKGGLVGPALDGVGARLEKDFMEQWLRDPQTVKAGTLMPKLPLSEAQIGELATFLSTLGKGN